MKSEGILLLYPLYKVRGNFDVVSVYNWSNRNWKLKGRKTHSICTVLTREVLISAGSKMSNAVSVIQRPYDLYIRNMKNMQSAQMKNQQK